jgi:hypothetical protein
MPNPSIELTRSGRSRHAAHAKRWASQMRKRFNGLMEA